MSKYKIVITDYYYPDQTQEALSYAKLGDDVEITDLTKIVKGGMFEPDELLPYVRDCDALVVQFAKIDKRLIHAMERCKVIARYAIGVDNIDVAAATDKHIYVANVPDYCIDEVANTAIAHLMNGMRKLTTARDMLLDGTFDMNAIRPLKRMCDVTLTLLGFGNIARNVASKMRPFFKEIIAYDPFFKDKAAFPYVRFTDLDEALRCADAISIHIPLNESTKGMLNAQAFSSMKPGVVIVNTARGGIIDEAALLSALQGDTIAHCGLDVISTEDFRSSSLLHEKKITLTPHIAWCSEEATSELQRKVGENVTETLLHGVPKYHVNAW